MALPGLFIEYLVVGALALFWVLPLGGLQGAAIELNALQAAALVPAIYVIGMFIDSAAFAVVTWLPRKGGTYKARARRFVGSDRASRVADFWKFVWKGFPELEDRRAEDDKNAERDKLEIQLPEKLPEVAKQLEMRSSRDRIARSSILNLGLIGVVNLVCNPVLAILCFALALWAVPMWVFYEANSHGLKEKALKQLEHLDE